MASMFAASTFSGVSVRVQSKTRAAGRTPLRVSAATKKTPAPPPSRFAKAAPKEATLALVCGQCGYVYSNAKAFSAQPSSYKCPVCKAPKSAFSEKDVGAVNSLIPIIAAIVLAAAAGGFYLTKL